MSRKCPRSVEYKSIKEQKNMQFTGIIPARYASTRFPGKPLAVLGGKTVIERVYTQVYGQLDDLYVATDDPRIEEAVKGFGGKVVMTSTDCHSGTDRCRQAADQLQLKDNSVVINIQGDEPFILPQQIASLRQCFDDPTVDIATLVKPFTPEDGWAVLENPNSPKVVVNAKMEALYFSRSVIPYLRGVDQEEWLSRHTFYRHIGIYAYRTHVLREISCLPQSTLELAESLEQLRWLENGYKIRVGVTLIETIGIDTPNDLQRAEEWLKHHDQ